jgi:hypothetical protein
MDQIIDPRWDLRIHIDQQGIMPVIIADGDGVHDALLKQDSCSRAHAAQYANPREGHRVFSASRSAAGHGVSWLRQRSADNNTRVAASLQSLGISNGLEKAIAN